MIDFGDDTSPRLTRAEIDVSTTLDDEIRQKDLALAELRDKHKALERKMHDTLDELSKGIGEDRKGELFKEIELDGRLKSREMELLEMQDVVRQLNQRIQREVLRANESERQLISLHREINANSNLKSAIQRVEAKRGELKAVSFELDRKQKLLEGVQDNIFRLKVEHNELVEAYNELVEDFKGKKGELLNVQRRISQARKELGVFDKKVEKKYSSGKFKSLVKKK